MLVVCALVKTLIYYKGLTYDRTWYAIKHNFPKPIERMIR